MGKRIWWIAGAVLVFTVAVVGLLWLLPPAPLTDADLRGIPADRRVQLQQDQERLRNEVRGTILQAVAGLLVIGGAAGTVWQVHVNREGQVTDRFSRAVDQLGSDKVDIRIGGVYALERIAKNSRADRTTIQFILGAFIRNNATWLDGITPVLDERPWLHVRQPDVQAAAHVLALRPRGEFNLETKLYLSRVDLAGVQLHQGRLVNTQIRHANLARAWLRETELDGSDLRDTDLRKANLSGATLVGTSLRGANLAGADLRGADLTGADLDGADLTDVIADDTTRWPEGYRAS